MWSTMGRSAPSPPSTCPRGRTGGDHQPPVCARRCRHRHWSRGGVPSLRAPADRIGDVVVVSTKHKVLGTSRAKHDLSGLLRVVCWLSRPCRASPTEKTRQQQRRAPAGTSGRPLRAVVLLGIALAMSLFETYELVANQRDGVLKVAITPWSRDMASRMVRRSGKLNARGADNGSASCKMRDGLQASSTATQQLP